MDKPDQTSTYTSTYGPYAAVYDRVWGPRLPAMILPVLDELLLPHLPERAALLDVCCGSGRIAGALAARGYQVTGLDISEDMLALARRNAPGCRFVQGDARAFDLAPVPGFDAALSTCDSFNEIASLADLGAVFTSVHRALAEGGLFVFNLLSADDYQPDEEERVFTQVEEEHVLIAREHFDRVRHQSRGEVTLFYRQGDGWQRADSTEQQRFHSAAELEAALAAAGFTGVRVLPRTVDLEPGGSYQRTYVVAVKPSA